LRSGRAPGACLALLAATAAAQPPDRGAAIRGHVDVRLEIRSLQRRPDVGALGMPGERGTPNRAQTVVYFETAPQAAFGEPPPGRVQMDQRRETFEPYALPVMVGTSVAFPNSDPVFHNVFSLSSPKRFDLGRYAAGQSKSVRFDRPGIVRVFCDIHSHMSAYILVFAHRFFAATDESGRYSIEGVPPGRYTLVAWTDGKERARRSVEVSDAASAVQVDFVIE